MLYTLDPRLQVPKDMILPAGPKRKRTNKREEPQTLFAGESAESIIRMVKAARQEGSEDKPEDNNGPEREYQPPDIEDPWDMSGVIQRLALSEAPGTTRPGEDAGRVEPRVDDPALPAPSGGATREGGVGGLRETWYDESRQVGEGSIAAASEPPPRDRLGKPCQEGSGTSAERASSNGSLISRRTPAGRAPVPLFPAHVWRSPSGP